MSTTAASARVCYWLKLLSKYKSLRGIDKPDVFIATGNGAVSHDSEIILVGESIGCAVTSDLLKVHPRFCPACCDCVMLDARPHKTNLQQAEEFAYCHDRCGQNHADRESYVAPIAIYRGPSYDRSELRSAEGRRREAHKNVD